MPYLRLFVANLAPTAACRSKPSSFAQRSLKWRVRKPLSNLPTDAGDRQAQREKRVPVRHPVRAKMTGKRHGKESASSHCNNGSRTVVFRLRRLQAGDKYLHLRRDRNKVRQRYRVLKRRRPGGSRGPWCGADWFGDRDAAPSPWLGGYC